MRPPTLLVALALASLLVITLAAHQLPSKPTFKHRRQSENDEEYLRRKAEYERQLEEYNRKLAEHNRRIAEQKEAERTGAEWQPDRQGPSNQVDRDPDPAQPTPDQQGPIQGRGRGGSYSRSYFETGSNPVTPNPDEQRPSRYDWGSRRRGRPTTESSQTEDHNSFQRNLYNQRSRYNTTTITRTSSSSNARWPTETTYDRVNPVPGPDPVAPDDDFYGPVRVTDTELHPTGSRTQTSSSSGSNYNFRRYNVSTASGSSRTQYPISSGSGPGLTNRVTNPLIWYNRTWHWSSNRTRAEYDPDLDGTTIAPDTEVNFAISSNFPPPPIYLHPWAVTESCDAGSCHPGVGNLLIGREANLSASSTCGLDGRQERFCMISELGQPSKCFACDSRRLDKSDRLWRFKYHAVKTMVPSSVDKDRDLLWWKADNGVQEVSIQLDLEAEFHFTHLLITFAYFRPAAMLLERSMDFGRTWSIYQYYAHDCGDAFPGVPTTQRLKLTDVVCTSKYSNVEPSTKGEVVFKVLPPNIAINDPYAMDVQNLLKVTNLRVNLTRLHTLGDNLLDSRQSVKEKYFHAIGSMYVHGYCSCYGHASSCRREPDQENVPDMVYGVCQCLHNTKGKNCEDCMDFYNDHPWKPAIGRENNACRMCNCNQHSRSCHFDQAVFVASGNVSGGICHDCSDNTYGKNCERCKEFFYRDSHRPLSDPCIACDCDPAGSEFEGLCEPSDDLAEGKTAGKCHCKANVEGRRCDTCKIGFWNFDENNPYGCEECLCNTLGTIGNQGCNQKTGMCTCKRNVVGRECSKCAPQFYGLGVEEEGCKACDCDDGGAYDNNCDYLTGQCSCRPHVTGRQCNQPDPLHFAPLPDYLTNEAETATKTSNDVQIMVREPYQGQGAPRSWTGPGFTRAFERSWLEFDIFEIPTTMEYDVFIRYEPSRSGRPEEVKVDLERLTGPPEPNGVCGQVNTLREDHKTATLSGNERQVPAGPGSFCLESGSRYRIRLEVASPYEVTRDGQQPSTLIDSIVISPSTSAIPFFSGSPAAEYKRADYERFRCQHGGQSVTKPTFPDVCTKYLTSIGFYTFNGATECACDPTGSESSLCATLGGQCSCKPNVVGRRCDKCAPGYYDFGPEGCKPCDCHSVGSLDNFCDAQSGQCKCRENTYGRMCDECQPGFWNYPQCVRCNCYGHTDSCDSRTGHCTACRDHTSGDHCEVCERGFYGNALLEDNSVPCRPCPCPGVPGSGISHADTCDLDPRTGAPVCHCLPGYAGERCDRCSENHFGNPASPGGTCQVCQCNGNTDLSTPGNCDSRTGECLKCLYNTEGRTCDRCKAGFFGDAANQQCAPCVCNPLGSDRSQNGVCDGVTGQCPCLPNVVGKECDECAPNHWKIASGEGCSACGCDVLGSHTLKCNEFSGQCHCKAGHGGRQCDECQANHWGDPRVECYRCDCAMSGSATAQCDRSTGNCVCVPGIAGPKCDQCARGYIGRAPHCEACGECFDNWDFTIQALKDHTQRLIDTARRVKQTGTTGAYKEEFTRIENTLTQIETIIAGANVTEADIEAINKLSVGLREELMSVQNSLQTLEDKMVDNAGRTTDANLALNHLRRGAEQLAAETRAIKENMTALQEANVEGAFNLTRDAQRRSAEANVKVLGTGSVIGSSANKRSSTEDLLNNFGAKYNQSFNSNEEGLVNLARQIKNLEDSVPDINNLVCDGRGTVDTCDTLCGGAGCGKCGGISCGEGAATKAASALDLGTKTKERLTVLQEQARKELEAILGAKSRSDEALAKAILAYERSLAARNRSADTTHALQTLLDDIDKFLEEEGAKPAEIRTVAQQCLAMEMSLAPAEILDLARQINDTMAGITNIENILTETSGDLARANELKTRADRAKARADEVLSTAKQVLDALTLAQAAQEKAEDAIRKANGDIANAQEDLKSITSEYDQASKLSTKVQDEIANLQDRLDTLKKAFTQNELDVRKAASEADGSGKLASEAKEGAATLEREFQRAKDALDKKAKDSGANKQRAEALRERAKALADAANAKFKELQAIEDEFDDNERRLKNHQKTIDELNRQMGDHLQAIESKSSFHRTCVP